MKLLKKLAQASIATLALAVLCSPALAQVTILDFGSLTANGGPNVAYTETIPGGAATDPAPVAFNGIAPDVSVITNASTTLNGGATIAWTDVTTWNNNPAGGNAGANYFAHQGSQTANPTTFTVTTANPTDTVLIEAVGGFSRDGLLGYGSSLGSPNLISIHDPNNQNGAGILDPGWQFVGTSTGSSSGTLELGTAADEGNVGAFRITITPSAIPEPSSLALLGLAGLSLFTRRRKSLI